MDAFIKLPKEERGIFFTEASRRHGMLSPRILEKDFWVCFSLKQLFGMQELGKHLT